MRNGDVEEDVWDCRRQAGHWFLRHGAVCFSSPAVGHSVLARHGTWPGPARDLSSLAHPILSPESMRHIVRSGRPYLWAGQILGASDLWLRALLGPSYHMLLFPIPAGGVCPRWGHWHPRMRVHLFSMTPRRTRDRRGPDFVPPAPSSGDQRHACFQTLTLANPLWTHQVADTRISHSLGSPASSPPCL